MPNDVKELLASIECGRTTGDARSWQGYFKATLVRGGPFVPIHSWHEVERDDAGDIISEVRFYIEVDGELVDPITPPGWPFWKPIDKAEFEFMKANAEWCRTYAPNEAAANPRKPVTLSEVRMF